MRMVIYDGFRFAATDLGEIHAQLMAFRSTAYGLIRDETCRFAARYAARRIDGAAIRGEACDSPLGNCMFELWERQAEIRKTRYRDVEVDFDFNLAVMPFEGRVYGIAYSERGAWKRSLMDQAWVEDYAYWDNGDRPDGLDAEEWSRRHDLWQRLMAQDDARRPSGCGFGVDFSVQNYWPKPEDILGRMPTHDERVVDHARLQAIEAAVKPIYAREEAEGRAPDPMAIFLEADRDLRTPEGEARLAAEAERLRTLLPPITLATLMGEASADGLDGGS